MKHIFLILFFIFLYSCSSSETTNYKKSSDVVNNLKSNVPEPWREINAEASDYALENKKTRSLFILNSACRKYEGSDLGTLTSSILTGIDNLKIIEKKNSFYQQREAAEVIASGTLDGVERYFKIITIHKNNCIYDYVLISTNQKNLTSDVPAFQTFLERIVLK